MTHAALRGARGTGGPARGHVPVRLGPRRIGKEALKGRAFDVTGVSGVSDGDAPAWMKPG